MSYYKALLLESEIRDITIPSIPEYKIDAIDLEDDNNPRWYQKLFEMMRKMIQWCKEKLIQLGKFISEKISKWVADGRIKKSIKRIKDARFFNLDKGRNPNEILIHALYPYLVKIKDKNLYQKEYNKIIKNMTASIELESNDKIIEAYNNAKYSVDQAGAWLLVNKQGKVRDIREVIKNTKEVIHYLKSDKISYDEIKIKFNIDDYVLHVDETFNNVKRFSNLAQPYLIPYCLDGIAVRNKFDINEDKFEVESIYLIMEIIDKEFDHAIKEARKLVDETKITIKEIETEINKAKGVKDYATYQYLSMKLDKFQLISSLTYTPIYYLANLSRLLNGLSNIMFSEQYLTTIEPPSNLLYHLSMDTNLGKDKNGLFEGRKLYARFPESGIHENLPERTSFSPFPHLCCYGLGYLFPYEKNGGIRKVTLYLYQGLPEYGKTRYIKPEIVKSAVASDSHMSQEICVTSEIKIKRLGAVEVTYNSGKPLHDPNRYHVKVKNK